MENRVREYTLMFGLFATAFYFMPRPTDLTPAVLAIFQPAEAAAVASEPAPARSSPVTQLLASSIPALPDPWPVSATPVAFVPPTEPPSNCAVQKAVMGCCPDEIINTAGILSEAKKQFSELEDIFAMSELVKDSIGGVGPVSFTDVIDELTGGVASDFGSMTDPLDVTSWLLPKDLAAEFGTFDGGKDFFRQSLTILGEDFEPLKDLTQGEFDVITIRRRNTVLQSALDGMASATMSREDLQESLATARKLSRNVRMAINEREQMVVVVDGLAALLTEQAKTRMLLANSLQIEASSKIQGTPILWNDAPAEELKH